MITRIASSVDPRALLNQLWLDPALDLQDSASALADIDEALGEAMGWRPRHNIAPPQHVLTIRSGAALGHTSDPWDNLQLTPMRWGLIPPWANHRKMGARHTTATARDLRDSATFAALWERGQRCVIIASGFYTSQPRDADRAPMLVTAPELPVFGVAGVWSGWPGDGEEEWIESCALITVEADGLPQRVAPAILDAAQIARWLDPATPEAELLKLLAPADADTLQIRKLSHLLEDAPEAPLPAPPHGDQLDIVDAINRVERERLTMRAEQLKLPWLAV